MPLSVRSVRSDISAAQTPFSRVLLSIKSGDEETYPSMSGASLSKFLTAAILASGVDGGPSVDIGKPMAIHKTTTRMKMDNKHQCCRRKWTPKAKKLSLRRE